MMMTMVLKMLRKLGQSSYFRCAHTVVRCVRDDASRARVAVRPLCRSVLAGTRRARYALGRMWPPIQDSVDTVLVRVCLCVLPGAPARKTWKTGGRSGCSSSLDVCRRGPRSPSCKQDQNVDTITHSFGFHNRSSLGSCYASGSLVSDDVQCHRTDLRDNTHAADDTRPALDNL
ncbi:uncharacterized protein LOC113202757 isoform X1 [Frankliniella occidentalis]|uniref:Uncharacterized protein LOC113202757 isoform X1 n=1 Tax=Frankliniella occidentalis TaxID=133901 RepID=A0A9C6U8S4_FRAOC|nr:uncharacterized protein LOC113202757 isoform X1 [Frankliniella occidentalis]XP_052125738.1 uncharacterized protein LOC113202757 isoform X1 [Frankliniella occidentalis]